MKKAFLISLALAFIASAPATVMNWDADGDYPEGGVGSATTPIQAYNNIDGSGVNISMYWTGETNKFLSNYIYNDGSNVATITLPDDDFSSIFNDLSALWYGLDSGGTVSLVMQFSQPVTNVSFNVWDIDGLIGQAGMEKVRVKGFLGGLGNGAVAPDVYSGGADLAFSLVAIGGVNDGLTISNKGLYDINPPAAEHMATVGFTGPIDTIGFQFTSTAANRGELIGDISFVVPEPATLILLGVGAFGLIRRKR